MKLAALVCRLGALRSSEILTDLMIMQPLSSTVVDVEDRRLEVVESVRFCFAS